MRAVLRSLFVVIALAGASLFLVAQDQGTHSTPSSAGHPAASGSSWSKGGTFNGQTARVGTPSSPAKPSPTPTNRPNNIPRGHRYPYGTPYALPYDSEYDQLPGHGTLESEQSPEPPDNSSGPTIFEHNGRVAAAVADSHSPSVRPPATAMESMARSSGGSVILVFRDGHQQEVENYAITGTRLIVIGDQPQQIALSDLDLDATARANHDRGTDFKTPKG